MIWFFQNYGFIKLRFLSKFRTFCQIFFVKLNFDFFKTLIWIVNFILFWKFWQTKHKKSQILLNFSDFFLIFFDFIWKFFQRTVIFTNNWYYTLILFVILFSIFDIYILIFDKKSTNNWILPRKNVIDAVFWTHGIFTKISPLNDFFEPQLWHIIFKIV